MRCHLAIIFSCDIDKLLKTAINSKYPHVSMKKLCLLICLTFNLLTGCTLNRVIYQKKIELCRLEKDAIINQALNYELAVPSNGIVEKAQLYRTAAIKKVGEADYEGAIAVLLAGLKAHPESFSLQSLLAALIGDTSEITPEPMKIEMVKTSEKMFAQLMKFVEFQPKDIYYKFKNEYFFRHANYLSQFENGRAFVEHFSLQGKLNPLGIDGFYCQGVGAAHYAKSLVSQGEISRAREYAQESIIAWAQYFSHENDYYNAYVHYALALGILGHSSDMLKALTRSASLIGKDLEYHEFKEVIDFVSYQSHDK
jgi:hypothetical protein